MGRAVDFALTAGAEGKRPTRDAVALFIRQLKRDGKNWGKPKPIPLRINGRLVTLSIVKGDNAASVAEDLKAIATRLGKHAEVLPDGWPFLFQSDRGSMLAASVAARGVPPPPIEDTPAHATRSIISCSVRSSTA